MSTKRKDKPFDNLYAQIEDIKDERGKLRNTVFSQRTVILLLS